MDETQMRMDGNAVAGRLQELFVPEMTAARGRCASCGQVGEMGAQLLYMYHQAPGAVLRCNNCNNVLLVLVQTDRFVRMGLPGLLWLEMQQP
jgi:Family of unknown function (DUF6510)